jgi:hypothetical protein
LDCSACLAAARFIAFGPLFFFRRAAARSDFESFGAGGMPPGVPRAHQAFDPARRRAAATSVFREGHRDRHARGGRAGYRRPPNMALATMMTTVTAITSNTIVVNVIPPP